ncbi:MAG: alkyl hydroperoxide reductase [Gemmataceae bacterium]|nr:alkyl hydroperoxide reductase [Gemmataceae bacterium]
MRQVRPCPKWMGVVLTFAGVYNLAWGAWTIVFPAVSFYYSGMEDPSKPLHYPQLWQCIGMIVGVYGIGYLIAARDPVRHWPLVLVGLLGKLFGPIGMVFGVLLGQTRPEGLFTIIPNDLVWWAPFAMILRHSYRIRTDSP